MGSEEIEKRAAEAGRLINYREKEEERSGKGAAERVVEGGRVEEGRSRQRTNGP